MPGEKTEVTEVATALGMVAPGLDAAFSYRPHQLAALPTDVWERLRSLYASGEHAASFASGFANGQAFLQAAEGLRGRPPQLIEWKGPDRPPGDDVIPADLRVDRVYLISCKYLSKVLLNPGPPRLFDRLLIGDERSGGNWFATCAPTEFQAFYQASRISSGLTDLPGLVGELTRAQQDALKATFPSRVLPAGLQSSWAELCRAVSHASADRWKAALSTDHDRRQLLWRLLRIPAATYFVLGADRANHLRLRVDSTWDWVQRYRLRTFTITPGSAGQPEVRWRAVVAQRDGGPDLFVDGHVEIRWSHGRFRGAPEAKVYLDTPHSQVPGYHPLA